MLRPAGVAICAALLVGVAGCADLRAINSAREERREFPLASVDAELTIDVHGGDLRIVAGTGSGDVVRVHRSLTGKATLPGNADWAMSDGTLRLGITCSGFVPDCGGRHIVELPAGTPVRVISEAGAVRAVGVTGKLTVDAQDGWVRVEDPSGPLRLRAALTVEVTRARSADVTAASEERDVRLNFAAAPRRVEARSVSGTVEIGLPPGPETYRIKTVAGTGTASSTVRSDRTVLAATEYGRVRVRTAG